MPALLSRSFIILRGVIYAAAFVWLWTWLAVSARSLDPGPPISLPLWLRPIGFVMASAGALLASVCIATFLIKGRGTPAPFDPPREFVATGPYCYVRNPMYVGATAVLLGAGLVVSSPSIVILAFGFLLLMHLFVVLHEEPALTARFGTSYQQYQSAVHRWLVRKPRSGGARPTVAENYHRSTWRSRSIEELEGDVWPNPDPTSATSLVECCHGARKRPIRDLSILELVRLLNERIGHPHVMREAVLRLREETHLEGHYYDGDLLVAVVRRASDGNLTKEECATIVGVCETALALHAGFSTDAEAANEIDRYLKRMRRK